MSTVLPPPAAGLLLVLVVPLPLLLQPTAAKAIAAKAAIAVVRLMIFLSLFEVVGARSPEAARPPRESIPEQIAGRANVAASTSAADSPLWRRAERSAVDPPNSG